MSGIKSSYALLGANVKWDALSIAWRASFIARATKLRSDTAGDRGEVDSGKFREGSAPAAAGGESSWLRKDWIVEIPFIFVLFLVCRYGNHITICFEFQLCLLSLFCNSLVVSGLRRIVNLSH